jgi:hypothetical protein
VATRVFVAALVIAAFAGSGSAEAAPTLSHFSVTPSRVLAGGHPDLRVSLGFSEPAVVKDISLHLPGGLTADPRAIPFCSRKRLLANLCSPRTKVGSITVVGVAYGFELPVIRKIYNVRYGPGEKLRLAVPIFGTYSQPGIAAELPVTARPADQGLDMAVTGLPSDVRGIPLRVREISFWMKGVARTRKRRKVVKKAFLTNPLTCTPAVSVLGVTLHDQPAAPLSAASSFTPVGCS